MTSTPSSDGDAAKLMADVASIVRVQARLKKVSDEGKLHSILSALLPRLLTRLEEYSIRTSVRQYSQAQKLKSEAIEHICVILAEVTQRMKNSGMEAKDVILSTLPFVQSKSPLASTWALSVLSIGMHRENPSASIPTQTMAHLIYAVDDLHAEAMQSLSPVYPHRFFTASWILLDCFVLWATVKPLLSWEQIDHDWCIRYERHISRCSVAKDHKDAVSASATNGNGMFHLLLDLLLLPLSSPLHAELHISEIGCMRMGHRHKSIRSPTGQTPWHQQAKRLRWSDMAMTYLYHVKLIAIQCAIWPFEKGLYQGIKWECAVVLSALVASKETMHGRVALNFLDRMDAKYSLDAMLSLLVLLVGDGKALELQKENGGVSNTSWEHILGPIPGNSSMQRPPLPIHIAEGVMSFLVERELQELDISVDLRNSILLAVDMCFWWAKSSNRDGIPPAKEKRKWFYSIRLLKLIYRKVVQAHLIDKENLDAWAMDFIGKCLKVCVGVLSIVLEAGQSNVEKLRKRTRAVAGIPAPFGHRSDLNNLLNDHREGQKRRQLSTDDAIEAREIAYEFMSLLSAHAVRCSETFFQLPSLLLGCAIYEEESLQQSVTDALHSLLEVYTRALPDWRQLSGAKTIKDSTHLATPLLPLLLDAICADSTNARQNAKEWIDSILQILDPQAASFLLSCLTCIGSGFSAPSITDVLDQVHALLPPTDISSVSLNNIEGIESIIGTIRGLTMELVSEWNMSYDVAQCVLLDHHFSLAEAKASCHFDLEALLMTFESSKNNQNTRCKSCMVVSCEVCYDEVELANCHVLMCGHTFCTSCWRSFIKEAVDQSSSGLLHLTCPHHQCNLRVTSKHLEVIDSSYSKTWETSFVEAFVKAKAAYRFCTGPDCQCVLHRTTESNQNGKNVTCQTCSATFCFDCGGMPHLPATCRHVSEWESLVGNSSFWIRSNAKPCPGCNVPIEKNGGCSHMVCKHCETQFCWLCLTKLRFHSEAHACNQYTSNGKSSDDMDRGLFLAKRYEAHEDAQLFAKDQKRNLEEKPVCQIEEDHFDTLQSALAVVVESRIFLKNSYIACFGYRNDAIKLSELESHQGALEVLTEKLSQLTEMNVQRIHREQGRSRLMMHFQRLSFYQFSVCTYMARILELDLDE